MKTLLEPDNISLDTSLPHSIVSGFWCLPRCHGLKSTTEIVEYFELWAFGVITIQHFLGFMQVLFSSVAALLGSPGQANYAAANACLDAQAASQTQSGLPGVTSVQWGAWAGGGMAANDATSVRMERMGMGLIQPSAGLAVLAGIFSHPHTGQTPYQTPSSLAANPFKWKAFLGRLSAAQAGLFSEFLEPETSLGAANSGAVLGTSAGPRISLEAVESAVASAVASLLGGSVSSDAGLMEAGLDSLASVELRNSLSAQFGLELPATLTFDYPTTSAISRHVFEQLAPHDVPVPAGLPVEQQESTLVTRSGAVESALTLSAVSLR